MEKLIKERLNNLPIVELFKRKEKGRRKRKKVEGMETFNKSTKVERSPVRKEGRREDILRGIRAKFKELMREIKELRKGKEEIKMWMEKMRKG